MVHSPDGGPEEAAEQILGMDIRGHTVKKVLVESGADIESEMYLSVTVDREAKQALILFSTEGGVDIEEVAETVTPMPSCVTHVDPLDRAPAIPGA